MKRLNGPTSLANARHKNACFACTGEYDAEARWTHDRACPTLTRRARAALADSRTQTDTTQETE